MQVKGDQEGLNWIYGQFGTLYYIKMHCDWKAALSLGFNTSFSLIVERH
jgi:hypothetical protein